MNWQQPIDIYCERLDAGFWAEPLNAISNAAFVVAALLAWRLYRRVGLPQFKEVPLLIAMLAMVGVGSFLFHSFAVQWALLADVLPILFFQIMALWTYLRRRLACGMVICWLAVIIYAAASQVISQLVPDTLLNGSTGYLPSLLVQWLLAIFLWRRHREAARLMMMAGGLFLLSLTFRSLDMAACGAVPFGLHFLWHILNAVVLYLVVRGLMRVK